MCQPLDPNVLAILDKLYVRPDPKLIERYNAGLARFAVGAVKGFANATEDDRKLFAKVAQKAFAEALRKIDDQAKACTKDRCKGARYWTRDALISAARDRNVAFCRPKKGEIEPGQRVRGEHTIPVDNIAEQLWKNPSLTVDDARLILDRRCIVAMTGDEVKLAGTGNGASADASAFDRYRGKGISDIFDLSQQGTERLRPVWAAGDAKPSQGGA